MDQIGLLDQLADNCYTSGPKLALEPACGPAVTLQDAGVSAGGGMGVLKIFQISSKGVEGSFRCVCRKF